MNIEDVKIGMLARLNSGGPLMTVSAIGKEKVMCSYMFLENCYFTPQGDAGLREMTINPLCLTEGSQIGSKTKIKGATK